ncbi:sensor histidine kinase [Rossellomorea aquimaris]|uniref:sensor histidine kinase n=1 Tax=Rossellomorea aquimaris TaxID=189382 RepID=UPI0005C9F4B1|nr:ATP-binding protein [Rossellomorea aquimaris]
MKRISLFQSTLKYKDITNIYRFLSWFLTSLFFLLNSPSHFNVFKFTVVSLLFLSSLLIVWLYEKVRHIKWRIIVLLLVEMIGISLLLIPTGALDSPFLWYALNPVLLAASVLPATYSWLILMFYLGSTSVTSYIITGASMQFEVIGQHSPLLLVFILTTLAVQLLSAAKKELAIKNRQLEKQRRDLESTNQKLEVSIRQNQESIEHIMSLYQITEGITSKNSRENVGKTFSEYARLLSKSPLAFFWMSNDQGDKENIYFSRKGKGLEVKIKEMNVNIKKSWIESGFHHTPAKMHLSGKTFLVTTVTSTTRKFGVIGVELAKSIDEQMLSKQLIFLADLSSIVLERIAYEDINHKMILLEEQNRIANEIHDSVSQRLFSIVYGIHSLKRLTVDDNLLGQLSVIEECSREAASELRECIYKLSSRKNSEKTFVDHLETYLTQLSKLNEKTINLVTSGDAEKIPFIEKQRILRLVKESVGNAIRHGNATELVVRLSVFQDHSMLEIEDDGSGFDLRKPGLKRGLGLQNMCDLAELSKGSFKIHSQIGKGTKINIKLSHSITIAI